MENDPFDKIFGKPEELDREKREALASLIEPYAKIDPENGVFFPNQNWNQLSTKLKILAYLLSRLALSSRNPNFPNSVSTKDVENDTELPGGTVRPKLRQLIDDRVVDQNIDGRYYVKSSWISINNALALFEKENQT